MLFIKCVNHLMEKKIFQLSFETQSYYIYFSLFILLPRCWSSFAVVFLPVKLKSYLYKTTFCNKVALDVQLMIFFYLKKK